MKAELLAAAILSLATSAAWADGGSFSVKYTKADPIPVGGAEGHIIYLGEAHGTNKGGSIDGADVLSRDFVDITQGNGTHRGYVMCNKGGDAKLAKFEGKVSTTLASDGRPNTTFAGNWTWYRGVQKTRRKERHIKAISLPKPIMSSSGRTKLLQGPALPALGNRRKNERFANSATLFRRMERA